MLINGLHIASDTLRQRYLNIPRSQLTQGLFLTLYSRSSGAHLTPPCYWKVNDIPEVPAHSHAPILSLTQLSSWISTETHHYPNPFPKQEAMRTSAEQTNKDREGGVGGKGRTHAHKHVFSGQGLFCLATIAVFIFIERLGEGS